MKCLSIGEELLCSPMLLLLVCSAVVRILLRHSLLLLVLLLTAYSSFLNLILSIRPDSGSLIPV